MKKRAYTIVELLILGAFILIGLIAIASIGYVGWHFLQKIW